MREAFVSQAALDSHCQTDYFQAFAAQAESLLAEPLQLIFWMRSATLNPFGRGPDFYSYLKCEIRCVLSKLSRQSLPACIY